MRSRGLLLLVLLTLPSLHRARAQGEHPFDKWDAADVNTRRLPPSAFPNLPKEIVLELVKRSCTIPQSFADPKPHNVIRGEFARTGEFDWAVLCSVNRTSSILVFWNGSANAPAEIAMEPDKNRLQTIDAKGSIRYSRMISPARKSSVEQHNRASAASGAIKALNVDHDGIDDAFLEKASTVHYYTGKWLELAGAD